MWGQTKSTGEATMYPKPVQDLNGWNIRSMGCGYVVFSEMLKLLVLSVMDTSGPTLDRVFCRSKCPGEPQEAQKTKRFNSACICLTEKYNLSNYIRISQAFKRYTFVFSMKFDTIGWLYFFGPAEFSEDQLKSKLTGLNNLNALKSFRHF